MSRWEAGPPETPGLSTRLDGGALHVAFEGEAIDAAALLAVLRAARFDAAVRVVVLRNAVDLQGSFTDGACVDIARSVQSLDLPVIAEARGRWRGDALALLAACDIVHAASDASFVLTVANDPGSPAVRALSEVMTARSIRLHAIDGRPFEGTEAERHGLVTFAFPADQLSRETQALVATLLEKDPLALRFTKQTLRHVPGMDWDAVLDYQAAKSAEFKALQSGSTRAAAVESFLAGTSKPGLGG